MMGQTALFTVSDDKPLPEQIAEQYGFPLAYIDVGSTRYYAIKDWIVGIVRPPRANSSWYDFRVRLKRAEIYNSESFVRLPYKTADGKTYQMEHTTARFLYAILYAASLSSGIVSDVLFGVPFQGGQAKSGHVYVITADETPGKYKIGISKNVDKRIFELQTVVPVTYRVIHIIKCSDMRQEEKRLHRLFEDKRVVGEWFSLTDEDLAYIKSI
jgi:hypothetical protein